MKTRNAVIMMMITTALMGVPVRGALIAHWTGDNTTSDLVAGRDGTLLNGAGYGPGRIGEAFSLDSATSDSISVPDDDVWSFGSSPFTIALWANFDSITQGSSGSLPNTFIGHDEGGGYRDKWVFFYNGSEEKLVFHTNGSSAYEFATSPDAISLNTGEWHHFAITRTNNTYAFYADGNMLGTVASSVSSLGNADAPLTIGQAEGLGWFDGRLDDLRIYDEALEIDEVQALALIPEPSSIAMIGLVSGCAVFVRRRFVV